MIGLEGTGAYDATYWLNAHLEIESFGGGSNNDVSSAVDLASSSIGLPGGADRLAAVGRVDDSGHDYYRFDLQAGEIATLGLTGTAEGAAEGSLTLELLDPSGSLITMGQDTWSNFHQTILDFVAPGDGTYYARVSGETDLEYTLVVTRGADFNLEPNDQAATAQDISLTGTVLGSLNLREGGGGGAIRVAVHAGSYGNAVRDQLNNDTWFDFEAVSVTGSQIDTLEELAGYDVVLIGDYTVEYELASFAPVLRQWVEAGHGVVGTGWLI
jgi:autotransporter adhesin